MPECRYCGNDHPVAELCRARRVSRRAFLFTASVAAAGALLPAPPPALLGGPQVTELWSAKWTLLSNLDMMNRILKEQYSPAIAAQLQATKTLTYGLWNDDDDGPVLRRS